MVFYLTCFRAVFRRWSVKKRPDLKFQCLCYMEPEGNNVCVTALPSVCCLILTVAAASADLFLFVMVEWCTGAQTPVVPGRVLQKATQLAQQRPSVVPSIKRLLRRVERKWRLEFMVHMFTGVSYCDSATCPYKERQGDAEREVEEQTWGVSFEQVLPVSSQFHRWKIPAPSSFQSFLCPFSRFCCCCTNRYLLTLFYLC